MSLFDFLSTMAGYGEARRASEREKSEAEYKKESIAVARERLKLEEEEAERKRKFEAGEGGKQRQHELLMQSITENSKRAIQELVNSGAIDVQKIKNQSDELVARMTNEARLQGISMENLNRQHLQELQNAVEREGYALKWDIAMKELGIKNRTLMVQMWELVENQFAGLEGMFSQMTAGKMGGYQNLFKAKLDAMQIMVDSMNSILPKGEKLPKMSDIIVPQGRGFSGIDLSGYQIRSPQQGEEAMGGMPFAQGQDNSAVAPAPAPRIPRQAPQPGAPMPGARMGPGASYSLNPQHQLAADGWAAQIAEYPQLAEDLDNFMGQIQSTAGWDNQYSDLVKNYVRSRVQQFNPALKLR